MALMPLALILAVLGLGLFGLGLHRISRLRLVSGGVQGISGALLLTVGLFFASVSANLYTYQRLNHESPVATVRFDRIGPQYFRAYLSRPEGRTEIYDLHGDDWQIDARILKWHGLATLAGLDSLLQLRRIRGRYRSIEQAREANPGIYTLYTPQGVDVWELAHRYPRLPWVDAVYGSATFLPMAHGARFEIRLSQSGLVARPLNRAAEQAIAGW